MNIIFAGSIGRFPVGGHAWIDMQYLLGLTRLGHKVTYLEECGEESWVYNWQTEELTTDLEYPTSYIRQCLKTSELSDNWIYRAGKSSVGLDVSTFMDICSESDLLIIRGVSLNLWRPEYNLPTRRAFIDVDPGFTQFKLANNDLELVNTVNKSEKLFTIGQRLGAADCSIPTLGYEWLNTVSPVSLQDWQYVESNDAVYFTTIMQWRSYKDAFYEGKSYGNKEKEFPKFITLPSLSTQPLKIALTGAPPEKFTDCGWEVIEGWSSSFTPSSYQKFIQESRAEICIAKQGYVATRGGWFSDRSICYLASGRPVLMQDTGLNDWLPTGNGIVTFSNLKEAVCGIEEINKNYEHHRRAARELAEQHFDATYVLTNLINTAMS